MLPRSCLFLMLGSFTGKHISTGPSTKGSLLFISMVSFIEGGEKLTKKWATGKILHVGVLAHLQHF